MAENDGYLLECLIKWTAARDLEIQPYGLDVLEKLADLARQKLPRFANHIFIGNAWTFIPPIKFDFVRTELLYVPENLGENFVISCPLDYLLNPKNPKEPKLCFVSPPRNSGEGLGVGCNDCGNHN